MTESGDFPREPFHLAVFTQLEHLLDPVFGPPGREVLVLRFLRVRCGFGKFCLFCSVFCRDARVILNWSALKAGGMIADLMTSFSVSSAAACTACFCRLASRVWATASAGGKGVFTDFIVAPSSSFGPGVASRRNSPASCSDGTGSGVSCSSMTVTASTATVAVAKPPSQRKAAAFSPAFEVSPGRVADGLVDQVRRLRRFHAVPFGLHSMQFVFERLRVFRYAWLVCHVTGSVNKCFSRDTA